MQPVSEQLQVAPSPQVIVQSPPVHSSNVQVSPGPHARLQRPSLQLPMTMVACPETPPLGTFGRMLQPAPQSSIRQLLPGAHAIEQPASHESRLHDGPSHSSTQPPVQVAR